MPKRTDINSILIIGSGPIVIGQGCEFDYSGTQACKALREEGYRVVLLNSNPATIMTDSEMADRTYIEPITPEFIAKVLENERRIGRPVDAMLPTLGGQTGLNCAVETADRGILARHGVEMLGANRDVIHRAEDRTEFKRVMQRIGVDVPHSGVAHTWPEAHRVVGQVKLPCVIRPAYTLGGEGGGFARTAEEFETIAKRGLEYSLNSEILIEEGVPETLVAVERMLDKLGVKIVIEGRNVRVPKDQELAVRYELGSAVPKIDDGPWPLFPADLLSIMTVIATQAEGTCMIFEKLFESRLFFTDRLIEMGARIILCDPHRAIVVGRSRLHGAQITSPDIRAGMALVLAALCAKGESVIHNIQQIDRGYERIEERLVGLGARIVREADR